MYSAVCSVTSGENGPTLTPVVMELQW